MPKTGLQDLLFYQTQRFHTNQGLSGKRNNYLMSRLVLLLAALLVLVNCRNEAALQPADGALEVKAQLQGDKLPVDGCGAHLWLILPSNPSSDSRTFQRLPTAATRSLMDKVVAAEVAKQPGGQFWMGTKEVKIRYRETTQTATLQCGWGKALEVRAIELLAIE
jgi:hypothetical protein